jgi:ATP-dependent DNA ligase
VLGADVEFLEWTATGTLRHPTFKALRVEGG